MAQKEKGSLFEFVELFGKSLPGAPLLVLLLLAISLITGMAAVALMHSSLALTDFRYVLVGGSVAGMLVVMLPALLTIMFVKAIKRRVQVKHVVFIAIISSLCYSVFILAGSLVYIATHNYALASAIIIVGDASIFGWWFFVSKFVLARKKSAVLVALVHPTLNILMYLQAQQLLFEFSDTLQSMLLKLYAGIFVFLLISYVIMYMFEKPVKKSLGISSIDTFVQMLQNWLFDINLSAPISNPIMGGAKTDLNTQTIILKNNAGKVKTVFFVPELHYGPAGTLGSSNFPYLLERHVTAKYGATAFIMHCAVNEDNNAISSSQLGQLAAAIDRSLSGAKPARAGANGLSYASAMHGTSHVSVLSFGRTGIVTLTRAPHITEDIAPAVSIVFKSLLKHFVDEPVMIDAHNARYASASSVELAGVPLNSQFMDEYIRAIEKLGKPSHSSKGVLAGSAATELYNSIGRPLDLGPGNINFVVFQFNEFKKGMLQFNANNMLPSFGRRLKHYIKSKYGIDTEVYTTDTHFVNALNRSADNVLGRHTRIDKLLPYVDNVVQQAMKGLEPVTVYYSKEQIKNFAVWGANSREKIMAVMDSVIYIAKILVPLIIIGGFVVAAWLISII